MLLKPGGYFAYSYPVAYAQDEDDLKIWREISALMDAFDIPIQHTPGLMIYFMLELAEDLLLEMDCILRPTGFIIICGKQSVVDFINKYLTALHWEAVAVYDTSLDAN
ncbi:hypothetical protein DVH24_018564 [Malus domestica]|uniref:Methyltransferase n=1 Tax=Malus domestica TaxID=3750 RepID=A0A498HJW9_MALDO|nr:hypothetical protein DVH24_018564 [Malus domestica]